MCLKEEKNMSVTAYVVWVGNGNGIQELASLSCSIWGDSCDVYIEGGVICFSSVILSL